MLKKLMLALCLLLTAGIAKGAGRYLSVHYNSTSYNFSGYDGAKDNNFSLNGIGIGYDYKWCPEELYEENILFFTDQNLKVNYDFGKTNNFGNRDSSLKMDMQDLNLQYSESIGYMINVYDEEFFISPYVGLNIKYHIFTRAKYEGESLNFYSKDDMGADSKWKRFQLGWQAGLDFAFTSPLHLRVEYGTDFIPNYSYKKDGFKEKINSRNLKISVGFRF